MIFIFYKSKRDKKEQNDERIKRLSCCVMLFFIFHPVDFVDPPKRPFRMLMAFLLSSFILFFGIFFNSS